MHHFGKNGGDMIYENGLEWNTVLLDDDLRRDDPECAAIIERVIAKAKGYTAPKPRVTVKPVTEPSRRLVRRSLEYKQAQMQKRVLKAA